MAVQSPKKSSALPWPALVPLGHHAGKPAISLQKMVILVGSRHNAHLHLLSRHVSKAHALILSHGGRVYIRDLASREQVYVNGVPQRDAWLEDGDLIKIGSFTFKYKEGPGALSNNDDAPPHEANLEIAGADSPLAVAEKVLLIGRRSTCDISLMEASVSTAHAVIFHVGGTRYIRDLGSRTGTFVNGAKVHQHPLEPDDAIRIGDTEMRYALSSEHDHAIVPADVLEVEPADEIDELEDLVGTAPLDMAAEIQRDGQILPAELEGVEGLAEATPAKDDDLIELEIAHEPQPRATPTPRPDVAAKAPPAADEGVRQFPRPQPKPIQATEPIELEPIELEPIELEPVADEPVEAASAPSTPAAKGLPIDDELDDLMRVPKVAEPDLVEIDLSTDPDVTDLPNAADTRAIGEEFLQPPAKPTLSDKVVDGPVEPTQPAQAKSASEESLEATWPDDLLPEDQADAASATAEVEDLSSRGGWQGMSRADELESALPKAEAPQEVAPAADEQPAPTESADEDLAASFTPAAEPAELPTDQLTTTPLAEALEPPAIEESTATEEIAEPEIFAKPGTKQSARQAKAEKAAEQKGKKGKGGRKSKKQKEAELQAAASAEVVPETPIESDIAALAASQEEVSTQLEATTDSITIEPPAAEPLIDDRTATQTSAFEPSTDEAPAPLVTPGEAPIAEVAGQVEPVAEFVTPTSNVAHSLEVTPSDLEAPADAELVSEIESASPVEETIPPEALQETFVPPAEPEAAASHEPEAPSLSEIDDLPPLENIGEEPIDEPTAVAELPSNEANSPQPVEPEQGQAPAATQPAPAAQGENEEDLSLLEEDLAVASAFLPPGHVSSPDDDDFFSGLEETLPVLELDSAELAPISSSRDPDSLLELDDDKPENTDRIEVIEPTEPTPDSALDFDLTGAEPTSELEDDSLTDSTFGRQVDAFTATSSGDIVEDDLDSLPDLEAVPDPDEELASLLESETGISRSEFAADADDLLPTDVTAGGIEPSALGIVTEENLTPGQFEVEGDAVRLETPGLAEADAVLGAQAFVGEADGLELEEAPPEAIDEQSFVAQGEAHAPQSALPKPQPQNGEAQSHSQPPQNGQPPQNPLPPAPPASHPSHGGPGNFVIGTDLSSFIGGMPLVLPDLAPPPTAFGRVQVSFAGAKAPWQQAQRPSFPMGQSLAQDVTDAAEGLRDVESMDDGLEPEPQPEASEYDELDDLGEGAPGDEWNVAAALEDDDTEPLTDWQAAQPAAPAQLPSPSADHETATPATELSEELEAESPAQLNVQAAAHTIEELHPQAGDEERTPLDEEGGGFLALDESEETAPPEGQPLDLLDEDELMKELDAGPMPQLETESTEAPPEETLPDELLPDDAHAEEHLADEVPPLDLQAPLAELPPQPPAAPAPVAAPAQPVAIEPPPAKPAPQAKAAAPPTVVPPPPARTPRPRSKPIEPPAPEPLSGDAVFGSMEHGQLGNAPFSGMSGVRDVDVFAQGSLAMGDAAEDALVKAPAKSRRGNDTGLASAQGNALEGRRPHRVIVPPRMGVLGTGAAAIENEMPGEPLARPVYRVIRKKSVARRVLFWFLLMLVCMGLVVGGIFYFYHPLQTSVGELHFERITALTKLQRDALRAAEFRKLDSSRIKLEARTNVAAQSIPPGFLEDTELFAKGVKYEWPDERQDVMTVSYTGPADPNNSRRLYALLMAMYEDSHADLDRERQIKSNIARLEKRIEEASQLTKRRDEMKKIVDASLSPVDVQKLEAAAHEADSAYDRAVAAVKDAQLAVRQAEQQLPPSPGEKLLHAPDPGAAPTDAELAALQKSLEDAASRVAAAKSAASEEADAKRKQLDHAIELFQQTASGLMKDNPQLAQYVQAVQQLQEQTHKLSGDLIEVQQQQHKRLSAIKKDIDDRVQARRTELWATDKALSDLRAQLDLAQRKYNAAIDSNYPVDSKDVKEALSDIRDLTGRIDARKMALGNDPIVTSVADALQDMINVTKERLEADRQRIEKDIKDQERAFAQSNAVEQLPETQRAQAAALKAKQEAINDLRKQYAAALDKRTTESNASLKDLEAQISSLNTKIDDRKRLLSANNAKNLTQQQEAQRRATLEEKQAALKQAEAQAAVARQAYAQSSRALTAAMAHTTERTAAQQELEAINQSLVGVTDAQRQDQLTLDQDKDLLKTLVTISKPVESSLRIETPRDDRWLYSAGALVVLSVLFGAMAVFSVSGADRALAQTDAEVEMLDANVEAGPLAIHQIGPAPAQHEAQTFAG